MRSNIDHDVFINQGKSIALASQVDNWLKAKGKSEPEQIPFGHSGFIESCKERGIDPARFSLRDHMTQSVEQAHAEKKAAKKVHVVPTEATEVKTERQRRDFNKNARKKAWANGEKKFFGICMHHHYQEFISKAEGTDHTCVLCRDLISKKQTSKRRKTKVTS